MIEPDHLPDEFPESMRGGFLRYVNHGIEPGSFLRAFFEGDYHEMCRRGGRELVADMWPATVFLHSRCPFGCYGSGAAVDRWVEVGGAEGSRREIEEAAG